MVELFQEGKMNAAQKLWFTAPRPVEEFYDVKADPDEVHNLINDPKYAADIARLKKEFDHWIKDYNKDWFLSEIDQRNRFWPNGVQPVVEAPTMKVTSAGVAVDCATPGASIAYQINGMAYGSKPGQWMLYTGPIKASAGDVVTVMGVRIGYKNSEQVKQTI